MKTYVAVFISLFAVYANAENMQEYLAETHRMIRAGQHEEALERCIWFHDNVLSHDPAMYGVRLSFALGYWKQLADKYPPAMDALVALRDSAESKARAGGDFHNFHDLVALNRTLGENDRSIEVFEYLDQEHPSVAQRNWSLVKDAVIDARRYDLARKYIEDPVREFTKVQTMYEHNMTLYDNPEIGGAHFRAYSENKLVTDAMKLINVALSIGDRDGAIKIRDMASTLVEDRRLQEAIPEAAESDVNTPATSRLAATSVKRADEPRSGVWNEYERRTQEEALRREQAWTLYEQKLDEETQRRDDAWVRANALRDRQEELLVRFESLLARWEEQADRYDRVLDAMEKRYVIQSDE